MKKELRPTHEDVSCDICGRTILKGERTEPYLAPGGQRHLVCELCTDRAYNEGWIRESAHGEMPASTRRPQERRSLFGRMRRRREGPEPVEVGAEEYVAHDLHGTNGGRRRWGTPPGKSKASAVCPPPPRPRGAPPPSRAARRNRRWRAGGRRGRFTTPST